MTRRRLSLKRETLTELTTAELAGVAGADEPASIVVACLVLDSLRNTCRYCPPTGYCPTLFC